MRPPALLLITLCACSCTWPCNARPKGMQMQSQYLRAITTYRRLERSLPPQELRALTALGLLNGARQAEEQMEQHLVQEIKELLQETDLQQGNQVMLKIDEIEQELMRDKRALNILSSAVDVLGTTKNEQQFRQDLRSILEQERSEFQQNQQSHNSIDQLQLGERLGQLRLHILEQIPQMKSTLESKIEAALEQILKQATVDGPLAKASLKVLHKRAAEPEQTEEKPVERPKEMHVIKSILSEDDFRENLVEQQFEGSENSNKQLQPKDEIDEAALDIDSQNITAKPMPQTHGKQEDGDGFDDEGDAGGADAGGGGGGGLVGIIGSLSGGEGGSDVGALIGALTGLISSLFGPGGLDIESLISTSTSLLAGLLSGNKNFGVVLGQYVGTAFDGLSGGGGAVNNGQFLGHFLGTVLAALSADPEDEGPPQPLTFAKSFLSGFTESKFRPNSAEASEERHGSTELSFQKKKKDASGHSFDSGGFVKQIASHLVSSALGLLLNASLGASGGASHASAGLFTSSSHHMKSVTGRSWSPQPQPQQTYGY
ncbi:keratin, type I cytoskeletal 10 [Drosophila albomicans]|uniref:Keratin, type I cytoskeletal 10 n=1 Tax=Drosophila albomicans TaxID=7291 RepID=A0A6P8WYX1_DROAB|nr:keratin, type I cytoskeletal 10 [Drosophila albomicans]